MADSDLLEGIVSSGKAALSVLLVLVYGYVLRKLNLITTEGESNITALCTKIFLPALLFTEIGPLASAENLKSYWPIIPLSLFFQSVALAVAIASRKLGMPKHLVPMFIFNNVTSLPLLLLSALAATGGLDPLVTPERSLESLTRSGRVYILLNALVGNLARFALGPYLMRVPQPEERRNLYDNVRDDESEQLLPQTDDDDSRMPTRRPREHRWFSAIIRVLNPPLAGGLLALVFGLVPWIRTALFGTGFLSPIADSINNVGRLFSASQMLVLGANLYSKKGSRVHPLILGWLFTYRFVIAPAISISVVYYLSTTWPSLLGPDPMLRYVLCMSNVGPPALTLSAVAVMAKLPVDEDSQISRILTFSYGVSPLIAFPLTTALSMIGHSL
ncbi:Dual specificity kinase 1 [Mycena kentingensis (nom. inval.)]|nr:Dual specificity kinase 1 [Mycena kentingensis (nom. inval.)]